MIEYRKMKSKEIDHNFLHQFLRDELVTHAWRIIDGEKKLVKVDYKEHWDCNELEMISMKLKNTIDLGGIVIAAFDKGRVVGFSSIESEKFGRNNNYNQLSEFHISSDYRGKGIGKKLFREAISHALNLSIEKLYISASSCENTQQFYKSVGCVDVLEINEKLVEKEPYDIQLEYELKTCCIGKINA